MSEKLCSGPSHAQPTYLPLDPAHWYFHQTGRSKGKAYSYCRACDGWMRTKNKDAPHGFVPSPLLRPYLRELIDRCGSTREVEARYGIHRSIQIRALNGITRNVRKSTFQRILVALGAQRQADRLAHATADRYHAQRMLIAQREAKLANGYPSPTTSTSTPLVA